MSADGRKRAKLEPRVALATIRLHMHLSAVVVVVVAAAATVALAAGARAPQIAAHLGARGPIKRDAQVSGAELGQPAQL